MLRPIPKQPPSYISYLLVGKWLHLALLLFVAESFFYWVQLESAYLTANNYIILFWLWCFLFSFIHIFLVLLDSWSRFQNYKRAKDQLYAYGFQPKIAQNYFQSKCQRNALKTAAIELGMEKEIQRFFILHQVKWHHFIPYFMIKDPFFLFKSYFWNRTFLEKYYEPKFNYRSVD